MSKLKLPKYPIGTRSHLLDSGAFTLISKAMKANGGRLNYDSYDTPEFWEYVDSYAEFVKKHKTAIDYYVNIDAIRNPKLSWKIQQYLQNKHGLRPLPVVHVGTDPKWIDKYIADGHDYIGFGGIAKSILNGGVTGWIDRMFTHICPGPSYLPIVRVHGFGVGNYQHIIKYPWYSIDSTTWVKMAYYGQIHIPEKRNGVFRYDKPSYRLFVDPASPYIVGGSSSTKVKHYEKMKAAEKEIVLEWLAFIKVPLGKTVDGKIIEAGVSNDSIIRQTANIEYYEWLQKQMPAWPRPFVPPPIRPRLLEALGLEGKKKKGHRN